MVATTVILRERVADRIRISAVDMTLEAEDALKIDNAIADASAMLREKGLLWWADNAIPDPCLLPMTLIVGAYACAPLGKAGQGYEADEAKGMDLLSALKPSSEISPVRAIYF